MAKLRFRPLQHLDCYLLVLKIIDGQPINFLHTLKWKKRKIKETNPNKFKINHNISHNYVPNPMSADRWYN